METKQQPYGKKVKLHIEQRNEWMRALQASMVAQVERLLREFYKAAVICHKRKHDLSIEEAYVKLIERSRLWSDEDVLKEIGERRSDGAEICLHEAIKEHAKVLSLSTATPCRTPLDVPSIVKFFRSVLALSADELSENDLEIVGTTDIALRKRVREWIGEIIVHKALEIVPISKFAGRSAPASEIIEPEVVAKEVKSLHASSTVPVSTPPAVPIPQAVEVVAPMEEPVIAEEPAVKKEAEEVVVEHTTSAPKAPSDEDDVDEEEDDEDEEEEEN